MLEIRIGKNMNFGGLGGGDAEKQAAPECPEEGEEGTHGSSAAKVKSVMGGLAFRGKTNADMGVRTPFFKTPQILTFCASIANI